MGDDVLSAEQVEAIGRDADDWLADEETLARLMRSHEALRAELAETGHRYDLVYVQWAAAQAKAAGLRAALADVLWIVHHEELRGAEAMAMIHGFRYSDEFLAECTRRREAAELALQPVRAARGGETT